MRRISRAAGALVACIITGVASAASASAGNGIRLGGTDGRLHPFLDYETRYDSNVSYVSNQRQGDLILHVRPGAELKIPGDRAVIEFSGAIDWAQYLGVEADTGDLSRLYADASFAALLNPRRPVSIRIDDDFRRQISTSSLAFASAVIANSNALTLSIPFKPGGGALVLTARGQWLLESYQAYSAGQDVSDLGYNEFRTGLDAQWKFLPRTSATFQAGFFSRLPNSSTSTNKASGVDVLAGVTGLVTPHVGVSLKAGYGGAFGSGNDFSTFLADIGTEWLPAEGASLRLGISRAFGIDPSASVYSTNSVYATGRMKMVQRYSFQTTVRYDYLSFAKLDATSAFFRIEPGIEGTVSRWLTATIAYAYSSRISDFPAGIPVADYSKQEAWLKLGFTY